MSRLLLHISVYKTSHLKKDISAHMGKLAKKKILRLVILFTLLGGNWVKAQHVDTWYTADRAINQAPLPSNGSLELFTPIPTIDGVSVFEWHDFVDFNPLTQIAIQHPNPLNYNQPYPNGFSIGFGTPSFLTPAGSIPDLPTLQMNSVNFNPEILFDGSGNGQALHARSVCREEMTIFIMFRAPGAGTTAETQRLLYGGDIETHHSSTTNLSLGVSNGNRFSIGRTRFGFDPDASVLLEGNIDLLGQPAIGVFTRQINGLAAQTERLTTKVNGILDVNTLRNDVMAQFDTYPFIRLGKHFNSNDPNRNLTGGISEILVADGLLDANSIQRVESYLAIKYGITLNGSASLGSISGNSSYQYLAADGTIIWAIDPTYRFDIAGIGKDRYEDFDAELPGTTGDLKLRYNLHQRISKSENSEAILTMSTSPNFITDNLDQTRTPINTGGSFSTDHNYLIWGSDRQSIAEVNSELPPLLPQITSRIEREWRVQMNNSTGLTPINGVSVRINLSGSTIIDNGDCALHLMIDTDNDGDFTTGPITLIQATSVDAFGNVYFDGVDFVHQNVFTVGFGDIENPTASNPDSLTVCDTAPAPDPLVVDDEDDNCAVDSVTHISDVSDGLSNPETITRTYRVTDTFGNFTDVQQTITVTGAQSTVFATLPTNDVCAVSQLPNIASLPTDDDNSVDGSWAVVDNGDDTHTYTFTPTDTNCYNSSQFTVTVTGFNITTNIEHETCWEIDNGSVSVAIGDAVFPVTVQLNSMEPMVFNTDSFSITDLSPGNYEMSIIDGAGCETNTNFTILQGGPNLSGSVDVMYLCDANLPSNTIDVTLFDSSISSNVLYALDSTDPNDFILSPDFGNINPGKHSLFILHGNGCVGEITFEVENFEPLELSLTSEYVNQITANVTGGTAPYTYYFDDNDATDSNTYTITRSGAFTVRVIDSNGCEVVQSISMNLMEITIPDFFTPNFDGQNDYWAPRNTELFPDIETYIFDRYGRKIWTLGPSEAWDGEYDSKPMPSGDYWYIVKLNDGSGREFVGHFTLYR